MNARICSAAVLLLLSGCRYIVLLPPGFGAVPDAMFCLSVIMTSVLGSAFGALLSLSTSFFFASSSSLLSLASSVLSCLA